MDFRRLKQVFKYGWQDAKTISGEPNVNKSRLVVFCDILHCYLKYNVWSNQYKKETLYSLSGEQRETICLKYKEKNTKRDKWVKEFFDNYKFLNKWSSFKYEMSASLQVKRRAAYKKQYGLGDNCFVGYDVIFHRHHYVDSKIVTGDNCGFSEGVNIDYTGGLLLGNRVWISEGAKILTHNHDMNFDPKDVNKGCILTPLIIRDYVWVGARAVIMPGVKEVGRGAIVSANSVVCIKVPPYAVVMGNPAKIVGFKLSPDEVKEHEALLYSPENRIDLEKYEKRYNAFFSSFNKVD